MAAGGHGRGAGLAGPVTGRVASVLALLLTAAGALLMTAAVVAIPPLWWDGFISEAGVGSPGHAATYRLGATGLAVGQAMFAVALSSVDRSPVVPLAVGLLAADAAFGTVSAAVSCSPGCPLPPHETPTARDLVHGGASILAVGLLSLAMLALALFGSDGRFAGPSRVAAALVTPLVVLDGLAILVLGRRHVTGLLGAGGAARRGRVDGGRVLAARRGACLTF
jgi:hypothetical protein